MAMQVDFVPEQKKIDIPKTTTTMSIQPINHMASALGGVGWFCILHCSMATACVGKDLGVQV
jgi:hypothetical protein